MVIFTIHHNAPWSRREFACVEWVLDPVGGAIPLRHDTHTLEEAQAIVPAKLARIAPGPDEAADLVEAWV